MAAARMGSIHPAVQSSFSVDLRPSVEVVEEQRFLLVLALMMMAGLLRLLAEVARKLQALTSTSRRLVLKPAARCALRLAEQSAEARELFASPLAMLCLPSEATLL
jgi:hypothetical protein